MPAAARPGGPRQGGSTRGRPAQPAPGLLASPGAAALRRGAAALAQWLRRPLTSLHLVLGVFGLLTLFGLVMVLSASSVEAYTAGGSSYSVFTKQLLFCVPGLAMFYLGLRIPPRQLRALAPVFLVVCVVLLVAVLAALGVTRNGSRAWFAVGSFTRAALGGGEGGAHAVGRARAGSGAAGGDAPVKYALSPVVPVTVVLFTLLVLEPDLGMTVTLGIVLVALLFYAGAPLRLMAALSRRAGGALPSWL